MKKLRNFMGALDLAEGKFDANAEYELISTAKQTDPRYGEFRFSKADLEEMAKNFNENVVGTDIPVDENHDPNHRAMAWLANGSARVGKSKKLNGEYSLFAKIDRHTPDGMKVMSTGGYRYFSLQIQHLFSKMVEGSKKQFKNVIRSLALTNQPVIKDLAPTFSETNLSLNSNTMDLEKFLELAENFLKEEKVTAAQITTLKTLSESFEGDDKTKANEKISLAEEKAEEEEEEPEEGDDDADKAAADAAEAAEKELAEKLGKKENFNLSEVNSILQTAVKNALAPVSKKLNEVMTDAREKSLSENVESLVLSDSNLVGFKPDAKKGIVEFVKTLSDVQAAQYFEIHKNIIEGVDLSEYGNALAPDVRNSQVQLAEKAKELMAADKTLSESKALELAMEQNVELAEKASECKQY